jgi:hypothetical protein
MARARAVGDHGEGVPPAPLAAGTWDDPLVRRELLTRWGRGLDPARVLEEYPRPQLVRDSHLSLNGWWEHAITPAGVTP